MERKKTPMKLKALAAAVALASAGAANAAMDNFQTGNGSLAFIALDTGSPISMMMDLDFNLDSFLASSALTSAAGTLIQWDFGLNTLTVNGVVSATTQDNWSGALSSFNAAAVSIAENPLDTTPLKWGVISGDSLSLSGSSTPLRYLSTSKAPLATVDNQTLSNLSQFSLVDILYNANNLIQTPASGLNGSTAGSGQAYVGNGGSFNINGNWQNKTTGGWSAYALEGETQSFYQLNGEAGNTATTALVNQYAGTFNYDAGVLTYSVAAIPEPSEYASLLAGLGMIGFMARRRLNRRG